MSLSSGELVHVVVAEARVPPLLQIFDELQGCSEDVTRCSPSCSSPEP